MIMNPDKLFDYLDGKLSRSERAELEDRIIADPQLQRELAVARRIHASISGDSREVVLADLETAERGRKMALRIGWFFIILTAVNVGAGLWIIARHESKNPNRALLEKQTREQISKSLEQAAAAALTPPPSLGINEVTVSVLAGHLNSAADELAAAANRMGGSATKGLPETHRLTVLADIPSSRVSEFRNAMAAIGTISPATSSPAGTPTRDTATSFVIHLVDTIPAPK
jgi:anti-sigma factor RsiW